ncbi:EthD domain-containing protein [Phaeosphaeria sp. MPI-PUGE-AT-0046c]|nr:EthD domain-containing protein [Phaeosphaeria sp. MPI-PUGE-AT-0046c]
MDSAEQGCVQIVTYIRRKRNLSPAQFYDHWENDHALKVAPWIEKHGIRRYQQIHVSGSMVPVPASNSAPNAVSTGALPITPIEFDGIALFLASSLQQFTDAFKDPYYIEIIEPDEREFLDKTGPGSGVVASFQGRMFDIVNRGQSMIQTDGRSEEYRRLFEDFQTRKI